jgi:hypothetical protein
MSRILLFAIAFLFLETGGPGPRAAAEPLAFSATGCGPYAPAEEPLLERYVRMVSGDGRSEFLVHLGDVVSGSRKKWPEAQYAKVAGILRQSRVPVFIVPGDNEWNDLDNPEEGWRFWTKHFLHFDRHFQGTPAVRRQGVRPENFAFESKGVLLIGINLVGGRVHDRKEWETRHRQDADWVRENFRAARARTRAAVILAQADPNKTHDSFTRELGPIAREFGKPVLFLHADGHIWKVQEGWLAPNMLRVMTDQLNRAPPVLVTVTDDPKRPFVFDRRLAKK